MDQIPILSWSYFLTNTIFFPLCRRMSRHPLRKRTRIPCLHKHGSRTSKLAHETFARRHGTHDAAAGHALQDVLAVPRYEMAVVDDVFLVGSELNICVSMIFEAELYGGLYFLLG